jgi:hypothetical protein
VEPIQNLPVGFAACRSPRSLCVDMKKQTKSTSGRPRAPIPKKAGRRRGQPKDSVKRIETDPALNNEESTAGTGMLPLSAMMIQMPPLRANPRLASQPLRFLLAKIKMEAVQEMLKRRCQENGKHG